MENMRYAEELLREFLIFRGFTNTLQSFESELSSEIGRNFETEKIVDLIFSIYIPKFQIEKLFGLLNFFKQCFTSPSETALISMLSKLELSVLRYYVVFALKTAQIDKVTEFFGVYGNYLLLKREDWLPWFALPYIKNPNLDPQFRVYFSKEWLDALITSFRNFLSEIFNGTHILFKSNYWICILLISNMKNSFLFILCEFSLIELRIPALLKISMEKITVKRLKNDIKQLNNRLSELQALLETKENEILGLKSMSCASVEKDDLLFNSNSNNSAVNPQTKNLGEPVFSKEKKIPIDISNEASSSSITQAGFEQDLNFPEVKVDFQETFLGHTSPISRCRFSASGTNIASASIDGTVRIWTYDSAAPSSRNATIYCGSEIMSLDWERRSDRLLLIGTNDGGIKAWNADAKRVVCDISTSKDYPSVLDLKCSPVEPIFVSAAASKRRGSSVLDRAGFASLTVWNMKTLKPMMVLPLGEDPPAITSICFNHNGKILAASATDGLIHIFDMSGGLQITGWPAHDTAVSSVLFGPAETSIFSLGSDGKIIEWSLHNQGQILWSTDCNRFCTEESWKECRHEISLDSEGNQLLITSGLVRSPIYQVQKRNNGLKTLAHSGNITSVDWHPTRNMFITGSADHSVRVTSII